MSELARGHRPHHWPEPLPSLALPSLLEAWAAATAEDGFSWQGMGALWALAQTVEEIVRLQARVEELERATDAYFDVGIGRAGQAHDQQQRIEEAVGLLREALVRLDVASKDYMNPGLARQKLLECRRSITAFLERQSTEP